MELFFSQGFPLSHLKPAACLSSYSDGQFSSQMAYCCWKISTILVVCFTVICIQMQYSSARLPSVFCREACYIWYQNRISCTKFKEDFFFFFLNRGKHGPPRGGIWVVGWIWICCQKRAFCSESNQTVFPPPLTPCCMLTQSMQSWARQKSSGIQGVLCSTESSQLPRNHPICDSKQIQNSINTLQTKIRSYRLKLLHEKDENWHNELPF